MQEPLDALDAQGEVGGEGGGGGAFAVGGDQLGDVTFGETLAQAPWSRRAQSRDTRRADERRGVTKSQVSGLRGVRLSGE
jgi:hypothetical protein